MHHLFIKISPKNKILEQPAVSILTNRNILLYIPNIMYLNKSKNKRSKKHMMQYSRQGIYIERQKKSKRGSADKNKSVNWINIFLFLLLIVVVVLFIVS